MFLFEIPDGKSIDYQVKIATKYWNKRTTKKEKIK